MRILQGAKQISVLRAKEKIEVELGDGCSGTVNAGNNEIILHLPSVEWR